MTPLLHLDIPNDPDGLTAALDAAEGFLQGWAVEAGDAAQVMIILDEVGSNIIRSAWPGGGAHLFQMELRMEAAAPGLEPHLVALDDGVAFDPTGSGPPDLDLDLDSREPGGLGLFMVGEMSDTMAYSRVGGQNRLHVTKRLHLAA